MQLGLPIGSFLAAALVLVPLPYHWRARNIATLAIIFWLSIVNVAHGVNVITWADNVKVQLVVWCDIVTRIDVAASIALPAACLSLCMHLERVASIRHARTSPSDKRRWMIIDLVLCFVVPVMEIGLYYVVQGHRFDIVENLGCQGETYVSIPELFLVRLPPILLSFATLVYASVALAHLMKRRVTFMSHLQSSGSGMTASRYIRLMALALVEIVWSLTVTLFTTTFVYRGGLRPWTNWADVHSNFSRIGQFPAFLLPANIISMAYFMWWTVPISAYLFFIFFAFGQEAMNDYTRSITWIRRVVLRHNVSMTSPETSITLPKFIVQYPSPPLRVNVIQSKFDDALSTPSDSSQKHVSFPHHDEESVPGLVVSYYENDVNGNPILTDSMPNDEQHFAASLPPYQCDRSTLT